MENRITAATQNTQQEFYTMNGYQKKTAGLLTPAMEDYLEMICRLCRQKPVVRLHDIAEHLHVKPSSASRMIGHLKKAGLVKAAKYGCISLTAAGREAGDYLLYRHTVVLRFLCLLNNSKDMLEQAEKIEHFLNPLTISNLARLTEEMESSARSDE